MEKGPNVIDFGVYKLKRKVCGELNLPMNASKKQIREALERLDLKDAEPLSEEDK